MSMAKKKRRRRRRHRQPGGFWRQEVGGAPYWSIGAAVVVMFGIGAYALLASPTAPTTASTPRPVPTFSYTEREPADTAPVALFIGDSYVAGAGVSDRQLRWTALASDELGWVEENRAEGGTGYFFAVGDGDSRRPSFQEAAAAVEGVDPDVIVVSGGRNDPADSEAYRTAVRGTIDNLQSRFPDARVVVVPPMWDDDAMPQMIADRIAVTTEIATDMGATVLDVGQPLVGNADLIGGDGTHPNDAGYRAIADAFIAAWENEGLS